MGRILVTYYSRTGHTRQVAEYAVARIGADIEQILEVTPRRGGLWGNTVTTFETLRGRPSAIHQLRADVADYNFVLFGTQVWASSLNPPARAFAVTYGARLKRYALFCTLGGMGSDRAFRQFAALVDAARTHPCDPAASAAQ